ncbi:MAG: hypothetical protein ACK58T_21850, partial [Phycisphaerae bacterium]
MPRIRSIPRSPEKNRAACHRHNHADTAPAAATANQRASIPFPVTDATTSGPNAASIANVTQANQAAINASGN